MNAEHVAYATPAIIAMYPTRGGWRGACQTCDWIEPRTHRSEREANRASRSHVAQTRRVSA